MRSLPYFLRGMTPSSKRPESLARFSLWVGRLPGSERTYIPILGAPPSMDLLPGQATPEGTARFRSRSVDTRSIPPSHFRRTPGSLELTSIGLGTYLGAPDPPTDFAVEEALVLAVSSLRSNAIDTAINYRFQRAERSVGRALRSLVESRVVRRDEVFVATKNGYLAPDSESTVPGSRYIEVELVKPGILRPSDIVDGSHAMSVPFLRDQFERSRKNLGLETLDLMYLHNAPDAQLPVVGREEFLDRLGAAFELYEGFRKEGTLVAYGLATWESLRSPRGAPAHLALEAAVEVATRVGGTAHGFRFIQFPFNVAMPEAALLKSQVVNGERKTLLEAARHLGLACFTSVPLLQGGLARNGPEAPGLSRAQTALQFARSAPGTLAPLVGQKTAEHISENLQVAESPPWDPERFASFL